MTDTGFMAVPERTQTSAMTEISKSKAVQEIQAALTIAKNFPRDINYAYQRTIEACKRPFLAQKAMYSYPRGGQTITGPSIRLAEVLAQNYGNLDFGVRELDRRDGISIAESYCWDMETNTRKVLTFEVKHEVKLKSGAIKKLDDPRDIYENVANNGARRLRACILAIIPIDIVDAAVQQVQATIAKGDGKPLLDRARVMVSAFKEHFGVTLEMIEARLEHKLDLITSAEFVELAGVYNSLKDNQASRADYFKMESPVKQIEARNEEEEANSIRLTLVNRFHDLQKLGADQEKLLNLINIKGINEISKMDSKKCYSALDVLADAFPDPHTEKKK